MANDPWIYVRYDDIRYESTINESTTQTEAKKGMDGCIKNDKQPFFHITMESMVHLLDGWETRFVAPTGSPLNRDILFWEYGYPKRSAPFIAPSLHHWRVHFEMIYERPTKNADPPQRGVQPINRRDAPPRAGR